MVIMTMTMTTTAVNSDEEADYDYDDHTGGFVWGVGGKDDMGVCNNSVPGTTTECLTDDVVLQTSLQVVEFLDTPILSYNMSSSHSSTSSSLSPPPATRQVLLTLNRTPVVAMKIQD